MPSKKRAEETKQVQKDRKVEEREEDFLEEEDEEDEEIDYTLDDDAEGKVEEALALLQTQTVENVPAFKSVDPVTSDSYPTASHLKNRVKYTPGDIAPEFNDTLILRKP